MQVLTSVVAAPQPRSPDVTVREAAVSQSQTQRNQRRFVLNVILIIVAITAIYLAGKYLLPKIIEWYEKMPPIGKLEGDATKPTKPGLFPKLVDLTEDSPLIAPSSRPVEVTSTAMMSNPDLVPVSDQWLKGLDGQAITVGVLEAAPSAMPSSYSLPAVQSALSAATAATTASTLALSIGTVILQTMLMVL